MRPQRPCDCGGDRKRAKGSAPRRNPQHVRQETQIERTARLRAEAEARNSAWAGLSPQEQLKRLDAAGLRAMRQRMRLETIGR